MRPLILYSTSYVTTIKINGPCMCVRVSLWELLLMNGDDQWVQGEWCKKYIFDTPEHIIEFHQIEGKINGTGHSQKLNLQKERITLTRRQLKMFHQQPWNRSASQPSSINTTQTKLKQWAAEISSCRNKHAVPSFMCLDPGDQVMENEFILKIAVIYKPWAFKMCCTITG